MPITLAMLAVLFPELRGAPEAEFEPDCETFVLAHCVRCARLIGFKSLL